MFVAAVDDFDCGVSIFLFLSALPLDVTSDGLTLLESAPICEHVCARRASGLFFESNCFFLRIERLAEGETALIRHLPSMECQVTCNRAVNIDYFLL